MMQFLKRLFLFAVTFTFTLTGAALMAGKRADAPRHCKRGSNVAVQQPRSEGITQTPEPEPKALTPYDIERFIKRNPEVSLKDLWRQLHVYPDFGDGEDPTATEPFLETCNGCEAEMFEYDLDDEPGKEILLRIEESGSESCRYLLFKHVPSHSDGYRWKLLGHIDWQFGRYRMPQHSVVVSGGRTWLLVEVQDGSGSGYSHYRYRLFKIDSSGVRELLSFPSAGYQAWCGSFPIQSFSSKLINCRASGRMTTIEIEYAAAYRNDYETEHPAGLLWAKKQRAVYTGDSRAIKLILDPAKSDLPAQEIKDIYENDTLHCSDIFKYNLAELQGIAAGRNVKRKAWLQEYLKQCKGNLETQELEQLLRQSNEKGRQP